MGNSVAPPLNTSEEMKKFVVKDDEGMKAKALEDGSYRDGNLYITRKGIDSLWDKYDRDGDGYLHDTEIKQFLFDLIHAIHNRNMEELENQKRIRKSRAGTIDSALRKRYQTRYEEIMMHTELFKSRISDLMHDLDKDSDGLVSEQQFVDYMMNFNILAWKDQFAGGENVKLDFDSPLIPPPSPSPSQSSNMVSSPKSINVKYRNTPGASPPIGSPMSPNTNTPNSSTRARSSSGQFGSSNSSPNSLKTKYEDRELDSEGYAVYREDFYEIHLPPLWKKGMAFPSGVAIFSSPIENGSTVKEDILVTQLFTRNASIEDQFKRLLKGSEKVTNFKVLKPMSFITDRKLQPYKKCAYCVLQFDQVLPMSQSSVSMSLYQKIVIIQDVMGLMHQIKYTTNITEHNPLDGEIVFDRMIREGLLTKSLLEVESKEVKLSKELSISYASVMHMEVQDGYVFLFHPVQILANNLERENFNAKILLPLNLDDQIKSVVDEILNSPKGELVSTEEIKVGEYGYYAKKLRFSYTMDKFQIGQICVFVKTPSCHYYFSYTSSLSMMSEELFNQFIDRLSFTLPSKIICIDNKPNSVPNMQTPIPLRQRSSTATTKGSTPTYSSSADTATKPLKF